MYTPSSDPQSHLMEGGGGAGSSEVMCTYGGGGGGKAGKLHVLVGG